MVPFVEWTEYLSSSKVSNIAPDPKSVSVIFAENTPVAPMATPVICVFIDKSELVNDTSETFLWYTKITKIRKFLKTSFLSL